MAFWGILRILGRVRVLNHGHAVRGLDRFQPQRPVRTGSGQDDADGFFLLVLGQRTKKEIDRGLQAAPFDRPGQMEGSARNGHVLVGRNDVDAVGLDGHAVRRLDDRHLRVARQQLDHQAFVLGIEMRNEHKGDAAVGRHGGEEFLESVQSAGRGADAGHGRTRLFRLAFHLARLCRQRRRLLI